MSLAMDMDMIIVFVFYAAHANILLLLQAKLPPNARTLPSHATST